MATGDTQLRFEVLGPLRVWWSGESVTLPGTRPRALLAMPLLHAGRPLGIQDLTEALWDGEPPASAPVNLRAHVRTLRRAFDRAADGLGDRVETSAPGYLIRVEPGELDLAAFEEHDARGWEAVDRDDTGGAALAGGPGPVARAGPRPQGRRRNGSPRGWPEPRSTGSRGRVGRRAQLFVWPVVLGGNNPALPTDTRAALELLDEHRFGNGVVHLRYRPRTAASI